MLAVCVSSLSQNTATSTKCAGRILPDLGIDAGEIDPLVEPAADPFVAGVGNEVREAADVFVVSRFQPIAPDHLHGALLAALGDEPKKQPRRVIVAFARAIVERALDRQFDKPAPREHRISGEIDIDLAKTASTRCPGPDWECLAAFILDNRFFHEAGRIPFSDLSRNLAEVRAVIIEARARAQTVFN